MLDDVKSDSLTSLLRGLSSDASITAADVRSIVEDTETADALITLMERSNSLRRRGTELRAIMSSTKNLLAVTDTDLLLQQIVEQTHELMELDIAYLSVFDETTNELRVRAATGIVSPRFLNMVVPPGIGLASLAATTKRPQWVEDYTHLLDVPHDPIIDEIVHEEELRSLLGAPLVVAGRVLGVLFGASRSPHTFIPEEVSLLSTFAGHASLVLHRTNLLSEARIATAQAASRQQEAEWAASLHERFTRLAVESQDASALVGSLARALEREAALIDHSGVLFASEPTGRFSQSFEPKKLGSLLKGQSSALTHGPIELVVPLVTATGQPRALIIASATTPLTPVQRRTVERTALLAALITLRQDAISHAEEEVRGELASELFEGHSREAGLQRAIARGFRIDTPWLLLVIGCESHQRSPVLNRLRRESGWLTTSVPAGVAVLAPTNEPERVSRQVFELVDGSANLVLTTVAEDLGSAAAAADATWMALSLAHGLGLGPGVYSASSFAPYTSLFAGDGERLSKYIDELLSPVLEWDNAHEAHLFDTLNALFDTQWNVSAASRLLHLHVNTMKQRIGRLRLLLRDDLVRPEVRFRLELAVRAEHARRLLHRT